MERRRRTAAIGVLLLAWAGTGPVVAAEVTGTDGPDVLEGTSGEDLVDALGGHDRVWAYRGADEVRGDAGRDRLDLGPGDDFGHGGPGDDTILGGPGDDVIGYGRGTNLYVGGTGADAIITAGSDTVYAGPGPDQVSLESPGLQWVSAGRGDDLVEIHALDDDVDVIRCGPGEDRVQYYIPAPDVPDRLVGCEHVADEG